MFEIRFTESALDSLDSFRKHEQVRLLDAIDVHLSKDDPLKETRKKKRLRQPNAVLSEWELRIDEYRVFYNVDIQDSMVLIEQVGKKEHNKLFICGKEFEL